MYKRKVYIDNMVWTDALRLWIEELESLGYFARQSEKVAVEEALGRITANPVYARLSCPHYPAAAMDGIAVRAECTRGASETRPVELVAGKDFVMVDTGDPVPAPFDAVIMIEEVDLTQSDRARIWAPATPYQHIRPIGEDVLKTQALCPSFTEIGPYEIGSFLTAGINEIEVIKKPRVVIIPTGTELIEPGGGKPKTGEIIESNSRMLAAMSAEWGGKAVRYPLLADDYEKIRQAVQRGAEEADLLVVCSGSSAGREDFTAHIIAELGKVTVHGLAIRPGKPAILGVINGKPVLGVPGYPVSAALIFKLFARPLLLRKGGGSDVEAEMIEAAVSRKMASPLGVDEFVLCNVAQMGGRLRAYPLSRGAGVTSSLVKADGYFVIPRGSEGIQAGETVRVNLERNRHLVERTLVAMGSHDLALDFLGDLLLKNYGLRLISSNVGSMGALAALRRGEAHFGGIHLLDPETGNYNTSYTERYLKGNHYLLVNLVIRQQGIMVAPGNPLGLRGIEDLARGGCRFINRQKGAGTRILLDYELSKRGIEPSSIEGYEREEYSHLAVAAAIEEGTADAGLGILASARALGLDFIPVAEEEYDLCILPDLFPDGWLDLLLKAIASDEFRSRVQEFGGYDLRLSGQVIEVRR